MKKLKLLVLMISLTSFAQVGIGTTTPLDALHVAGGTSAIRVDGLNQTNNVLNNGVSSNVEADINGKLVLKNNSVATTFLSNQTNILTTVVGVNAPSGTVATTVSRFIYSTTFTTAYPRLVYIRTTVSASFYEKPDLTKISDSNVRLIGSKLIINGGIKDEDRAWYTNKEGSMVGFLYLSNTTFMFLPAGPHTLGIEVFVIGGTRPVNGNPPTAPNLTYVEFGGSDSDFLQIVQF